MDQMFCFIEESEGEFWFVFVGYVVFYFFFEGYLEWFVESYWGWEFILFLCDELMYFELVNEVLVLFEDFLEIYVQYVVGVIFFDEQFGVFVVEFE